MDISNSCSCSCSCSIFHHSNIPSFRASQNLPLLLVFVLLLFPYEASCLHSCRRTKQADEVENFKSFASALRQDAAGACHGPDCIAEPCNVRRRGWLSTRSNHGS